MGLNTLRKQCAFKFAYIPLFRSISNKLFCIGQRSILRMGKQRKYSEDFNDNSVAAGCC